MLILVKFGLFTLASGTELNFIFRSENWSSNGINRFLKTCFIENQFVAKSSTVKLHVNENAEGLKMHDNKEVKHVPVNLAAAMPTLKAIRICGCAISSIGSDHFKKLLELFF